MVSEERCSAPEQARLCVNGCGFFGNAATMSMCSVCYRNFITKQAKEEFVKAAVKPEAAAGAALGSSSSSSGKPEAAAVPTVKVRCLACRKRVGLAGFTCRCGSVFCASHRYPEEHGCKCDYKAWGQEAIAKDNPVVKADKLSNRV